MCVSATDRRAMLEFLKLIDLDYCNAFTCPKCSQLPHDELVIIIDGKEMGMNRALAKPYVPAKFDGDVIVGIEWCVLCLAGSQKSNHECCASYCSGTCHLLCLLRLSHAAILAACMRTLSHSHTSLDARCSIGGQQALTREGMF